MSAAWEPREADWIQYLDGSLAPEARARFLLWLEANPEAALELQELQELDADLSLMPLPAVPSAELDQARQRVMGALPVTSHAQTQPEFSQSAWQRWNWLPLAAAALVVGVLLGRQSPLEGIAPKELELAAGSRSVDGVVEASVASPSRRTLDVQDLAVDARSGVRIRLQETASYEIKGSTADAEVQNTLSYIVRNDREAERRMTAIQLLDEHCSGQEVCQVLIYAMTQDPASAVRKEAALALQDDQQDNMVRQSFLKMMAEDPAPELRSLARGVLQDDMQANAPSQAVGR